MVARPIDGIVVSQESVEGAQSMLDAKWDPRALVVVTAPCIGDRYGTPVQARRCEAWLTSEAGVGKQCYAQAELQRHSRGNSRGSPSAPAAATTPVVVIRISAGATQPIVVGLAFYQSKRLEWTNQRPYPPPTTSIR